MIVGTGVRKGQIRAYAMVPVLANVSISGRVRTAFGNGIRNVPVTIAGGGLSAPVTIYTSSFGYFTFSNVPATLTYTITVSPKKFAIAEPTRLITPSADITEFDFVGEP